MQFAWKLGVVALVALLVLVLPGGGSAARVVLAALGIVFLVAIAMLGFRLYHQYRLDIDALDANSRLALYSSIGLAILTIVGTDRLFEVGGAGIVAWFALLALCSYGIYWVWVQYRSYS